MVHVRLTATAGIENRRTGQSKITGNAVFLTIFAWFWLPRCGLEGIHLPSERQGSSMDPGRLTLST